MPSGTSGTFTLRIPPGVPLSSVLAVTLVDESLIQRLEQLGLENPFQLGSRLSRPSKQARTREDVDPPGEVWRTDLEGSFRTPSPQSDPAGRGEVQALATPSGEQAETHGTVNDVANDRQLQFPCPPNARCYRRLPNEQLDWARVSLKTVEDYGNYRSRPRIPFHGAPSHSANGVLHEFSDDDEIAVVMQTIEE
ncbi:hypothetical protein MMYC01_201224 [Madurella mycetomatis]|uniref:Uncharacterized protein n=1 Tax=Madurella mycetomatis TaxID=100816 RepID=A0A175WG33_9PEZI|nr:hypothetical protein MMYC01_201224 [Madurella mycetomatis]